MVSKSHRKLPRNRSSAAFQLDDNGRVLGVRESSSSVSHQLIEELMVLANHVVAESLLKAGISDGQDEALCRDGGGDSFS
eukprot:s6679_g1.t1